MEKVKQWQKQEKLNNVLVYNLVYNHDLHNDKKRSKKNKKNNLVILIEWVGLNSASTAEVCIG